MALSKPMAGEAEDLSPMWNKILHQEEDLHQYVLQKLLHEAGPEHQSVGHTPDQCSLEPSTGIGRAGKRLGMLTGYTKPICKQSWTRLKKKKMNPALCMRALLLSQKWLHQMNSTFSYSFITFVSFFFVLNHYLHLILLYLFYDYLMT